MIENKIKKRRIAKLLKKEAEQLTQSDLIELAYYKHSTQQKISYNEYVLMLSTGDELTFEYKNSIYGNVHGALPGTVHFCITTYNGTDIVKQEYEIYESIEEMLRNVRIFDKTIEEIWKDIKF